MGSEMERAGSEAPWIVVGCGRLKHSDARPAADLYRSSYVTSAVTWARSVTAPERLLVLSAKHGLIDGRTVIEPYDVAFTGATARLAVTEAHLAEQVAALGLAGDLVVVAGVDYLGRLRRTGLVAPRNPFTDLVRSQGLRPGMGYQMQEMNRWRGRLPGSARGTTAHMSG